VLLTDVEIRVLGCLVEKALTTPQQYPLSENAVITACNQATNRDPVVSYEQGTVRRALLDLRQQGLARMVQRPGDRAPKHRHLLDEALGLDAAETAVLCVLLLRGPQTAGELRARTERMHPFADVAEVEQTLDRLAARDEPVVVRLARQPGRSQARAAHLLGEEPVVEPVAERPGTDGGEAAVNDSVAGAPRTLSALVDEVRALRAEVDDLHRAVAALSSGGRPASPEGASDEER
jgi:uncharacterized protein YceH (UPF0502 family)